MTRRLHEVAGDLAALLARHFATVRVSSVQTQDQLLREIKMINPDKLPGVIVIFDSLAFDSPSGVVRQEMTLLLIDAFRAGSEERAASLLRAGAALIDLFPADGMNLNGVWIHPSDCAASTPDPGYSALALGLVCQQGF